MSSLIEFPILLIILCIPFIGALVVISLRSVKLHRVRRLAILCTALPVPPIIYLFYQAITYNHIERYSVLYHRFTVPPVSPNQVISTAFALGVSGQSILLLLLSTIVVIIAGIAAIYIKKRQRLYYALLLLLQGSVLGLYMAQDAFLMISFFFIVVLCIFFFIGIWGHQNRIEAANRYLIYQLAGGFCLLLSLLILQTTDHPFMEEQSLSLLHMGSLHAEHYVDWIASPLIVISFALLLLGLLLVMPVVGMHRWYIALFRESHAVTALLYAGIQISLNLYIGYTLLTMYFPQFLMALSSYIMIIIAVQCLICAILMWRQQQFQLWIGYAVWSQIGMGWIAFSSLTVQGLTAAVIHMVSLSLIAALLLFANAGLQERFGVLQQHERYGLSRSMPFISGILLIGILALIGIPGLSPFIVHYLTSISSFNHSVWSGFILLCALTMIAMNGLKWIRSIHSRKESNRHELVKDARLIEAIPLIFMLAFIILIGIYPVMITDIVESAVVELFHFYNAIEPLSYEALKWSSFLSFAQGSDQLSSLLGTGMIAFSCVILIGSLIISGRKQSLHHQWYWQLLCQSMIPLAYIGVMLEQQAQIQWRALLIYVIMHGVVFGGLVWMMKYCTKCVGGRSVEVLSGLYYRQPLLAFVMLILLLSLIGIPFTSLFNVKLWLWASMITHDSWLLALVMIGIQLGAAITYINIINHMYMRSYEAKSS